VSRGLLRRYVNSLDMMGSKAFFRFDNEHYFNRLLPINFLSVLGEGLMNQNITVFQRATDLTGASVLKP
jgi:hypothetical protein